MTLRRSSLLALALSTVALGCQGEPVSEGASPIIKGMDSGPDDDAVVLFFSHEPQFDTPQGPYYESCTGTLLSPNVVLTARHCVTSTTEGTLTCNEDGTLKSGPGGSIVGDFMVSGIHVFVGPKLPATIDPTTFPGTAAALVHDNAGVLCNHDVALVVLDKPIADAKIAPVRTTGGATLGEQLYVVGWGATMTEAFPFTRQRRDGVTVKRMGPTTQQYFGSELADGEFLISESVCFGDSGGPVFDAATGAVVGVVSRGPSGGITQDGSGCVQTLHTIMQTAKFSGLIDEAFKMAGGQPWIEGQPMPGGSGGGGAGGGSGGSGGGMTSKGGGCSVAADAEESGAWWAVGLGLAAMVTRRRRR